MMMSFFQPQLRLIKMAICYSCINKRRKHHFFSDSVNSAQKYLSKDELKNINDHALKKLVEGLIDEMEERPDPGPGINNERKKR
ncbi:hypothetical protein lpari_02558 [Legionella parisiensis]|uniref:Uncharacterized protein n=1 Tax=Legionella parisiensis TaxID=45071 RepID=A0A1E5JP26_9GAMM|nr:hypothetical protein lpari_02558 [Legionella parisiensis]